jgi:hypothetical protein
MQKSKLDREGLLMEALDMAIKDCSQGMTTALVIGCLEMAKLIVLQESETD